MSIQIKPDYKIFASDAKSGEIDTFPDILRGWGVTIDRTGEIPPMEWFNAIGKRTDEWLLYLTQRGIPEWDSSLDYPKSAVVTHGDVIYISLKTTKGEQPNAAQAAWSPLSSFLGFGNYHTKTESDSKFQPKGDYATNTALNNGLALKFDKAGGTISGDVTFSKNAIKSTKGTHTLPDKSGTLMQMGDFGVGGSPTSSSENYTSTTIGCGFYAMPGGSANPWGANGGAYILNVRDGLYGFQIGKTTGNKSLSFRTLDNGEFSPTSVLYSTANTTKDSNGFLRTGSATALTTGQVVQTAGQSTTNVMSQKAVSGQLFGIGQTWQNVTMERSSGTNYTNTSGRAIAISIYSKVGESQILELKVDGITVYKYANNNVSPAGSLSGVAIVPPNSVYSVTSSTGIFSWLELR